MTTSVVRVPVFSSEDNQFFLSIAQWPDGKMESMPIRVYSDGKEQHLGDSIRVRDANHLGWLLETLAQGSWDPWSYGPLD